MLPSRRRDAPAAVTFPCSSFGFFHEELPDRNLRLFHAFVFRGRFDVDDVVQTVRRRNDNVKLQQMMTGIKAETLRRKMTAMSTTVRRRGNSEHVGRIGTELHGLEMITFFSHSGEGHWARITPSNGTSRNLTSPFIFPHLGQSPDDFFIEMSEFVIFQTSDFAVSAFFRHQSRIESDVIR